jgi:hypothetical protein
VRRARSAWVRRIRGEERGRKERKGKERKGKERKGKERKGKERKGNMMLKCRVSAQMPIVPDAPLEMYNEIYRLHNNDLLGAG